MKLRRPSDLESAVLWMWLGILVISVPACVLNIWLVWRDELNEKQILLINLALSWLALFTGAAAGAAALISAKRVKESGS